MLTNLFESPVVSFRRIFSCHLSISFPFSLCEEADPDVPGAPVVFSPGRTQLLILTLGGQRSGKLRPLSCYWRIGRVLFCFFLFFLNASSLVQGFPPRPGF